MVFLADPGSVIEFLATNVADYFATRKIIERYGLVGYKRIEASPIGEAEKWCQILETLKFGIPPIIGKQLAQYRARREVALSGDRPDFDFYRVVDTMMPERDFCDYMRGKGRILVFERAGNEETMITSAGSKMRFSDGRSCRVEYDPFAFLPYIFLGVVAQIAAENFDQAEWKSMMPDEAIIHLNGHGKVRRLFPILPEERFYAECNDGLKCIYDYPRNELWRYWI
jgi:hypothetical protein